ncbi:MAG TPA: hypothetical protein VF163_19810 [Micromonosporaceae bacterium]
MTTVVVLAVLAAAVLHAGWNALTKGTAARLELFVRMGTVSAVVGAVLLWWITPPAVPSWFWLGTSVVIHTGYNLGLLLAYRWGDFNQTYPIARGLGPLVVAVVAVLVLGERLSLAPALGVALIGGAVTMLGLVPWQQVRANRPAVLAAVGTGLAIAGYTVVDGIGVRRSGSAMGYTIWLIGLQGALTLLVILVARRWRTRLGSGGRAAAPAWSTAAAVALMSMLAYGLVLWAQTRGALAAVAALRESSVVVAAGIGMVAFGEPMGRLRIVAASAVAAGAVLLAWPT